MCYNARNMKRSNLRYIVPLSIVATLGIVIAAEAAFNGPPCSNPQSCNVPGVIWNVSGSPSSQPNAQMNFADPTTGNNFPVGSINYLSDVGLKNGRALRVDGVGTTSLNMGNWGSGQQPFNFTLYGDVKVQDFGGAAGQRGRMDAAQYCISGANCITAWPSGGGGSLTGITAGTGATVTGGAPSPTINVTDLYVNTTGDTMTGKLIINRPDYRTLEVNGGNGGSGAVFGNNTMANGYGGEFYGSYGIYATTPNNATGYYAGYFDGYSGGINAIGHMAGGVGVLGQNSGASSYGVRGIANNGYGGQFQDSTYYSYVGGQGYGILSNGLLYTTAGGYFGGAVTVNNGDLTINNSRNLCLGGVCKNAWPAGGTPGGANQQIQYNNSGAFAGSANFLWDNVNNRMTLNGTTFLKGGGATGWNTHIPYTDGRNYLRGTTIIADGATTELVGIGTAPSASYKLHVLGNMYTDGGSAGYYFKDRTTALNWALYSNADEARLWNSTYGDVYRFHNNGVLFAANDIVTNNNIYTTLGNIGAQVTSPAYPLDVAGTANLSSGIGSGVALRVNGAEALWYNGTYFSWGYGGSANYFADNVGIGVAAPAYQLQLSANSAAKPTSNVWTVASDKRLKDIHGTYDKGLDEIIKLDPITYTYKKGNVYNYPSDTMSIGAVAQDVQKVFPEAVSTDKNGYLQLDTNAINWASINAFKELKAENDALKAKNDELEARLDRIESRLNKLK